MEHIVFKLVIGEHISDHFGPKLRCLFLMIEKIVCYRVVPQKSAQDSGKDDEIAVDASFRH